MIAEASSVAMPRGDAVLPTPLEMARLYIERGWAVVPIGYREKGPRLVDWPKLRITTREVASYFGVEPGNIGVLLGEPSGGLTDVDLDAPEAVALAPAFLPRSRVFGRPSNRRSHWLFHCEGAKTTQFRDSDGTMLVEIRSTGAQTVFPGSTHPSGELVTFDDDSEPVFIGEADLGNCVRRLAAAALLARHWPNEGGRQDVALSLAGALLRGGWKDRDAEEFICAVADAANDEEAEKRGQCVATTRRRIELGEPATGLRRLGEVVGEQVAKRLAEWLELGLETPEWVEQMNRRYFVVNEAGKALVYQPVTDSVLGREMLVRYSFEDLRKLHLNERLTVGVRENGRPIVKDKATAWLEHSERRQYLGGVEFAPGLELPPDKYNLWRGFAIESGLGEWRLMQNHLLEVLCSGDREHYEYLIKWLARAVQRPGEQGEVAVVLRGGRGVGKGTVGNALLKIFGQHGVYVTNGKHLVGNFNAHLRDAVFVFVDEAFFAGDRAHESVLKGLITDPYLTIEAKYQNAVTVRNMTHILMASNEKWVVPAGEDERRFFVLEVSDKCKQDTAYFDALRAEMDGGGLEAMLHELLHLDLARFDVRQVPKTQALVDQKLHSLRGVEAWLFECLQRESMVPHVEWTESGLTIAKQAAHASYVDWSKQSREYAPQGMAQWSKTVRCVLRGCVSEQRRRATSATTALEAARRNMLPEEAKTGRQREFVFQSLNVCRSAFERYLNAKFDWDEGVED